MKKEPLWIDGYTLSGECFEHMGNFEEAYQMYQAAAIHSQSYALEDYERLSHIVLTAGRDPSVFEKGKNLSTAFILDEHNYEKTRDIIMKKLAKGTPAQQALIPKYEQAGKEAQKLRLEWTQK